MRLKLVWRNRIIGIGEKWHFERDNISLLHDMY